MGPFSGDYGIDFSILKVMENWAGPGNKARQPLGSGNLSGGHVFLNNKLLQQQLVLDSV